MILSLLLACRGTGACATPPSAPADPRLAVAVSDFQVGGLVLAGEDGAPSELLFGSTGDAIVRAGSSGLYLIERGGADVLTRLDPADPGCPVWQVSLPEGANAHDLVELDGVLWITAYDLPVLLGLSAEDGSLLHTLDLSAHAESDDGLPELDRLVAVDGVLWVAAQRLARDGTIWTSTDGLLLAVDPAGPTVIETVPTGPNPRVRLLDPTTLIVATGLLARGPNDPDAAARLVDGALQRFDLPTRTLGPAWLTEAEIGADLGAMVPHPGGLAVVAVAADARSRVICLDGDGWITSPQGPQWLVEGVWDGAGVMFASRRSLADDGVVQGGLVPLDPATCTLGSTRPTPLDPYDLALLGP